MARPVNNCYIMVSYDPSCDMSPFCLCSAIDMRWLLYKTINSSGESVYVGVLDQASTFHLWLTAFLLKNAHIWQHTHLHSSPNPFNTQAGKSATPPTPSLCFNPSLSVNRGELYQRPTRSRPSNSKHELTTVKSANTSSCHNTLNTTNGWIYEFQLKKNNLKWEYAEVLGKS